MTSEVYPGETPSALRRARKALKAAGVPLGKLEGRYPNHRKTNGVRVTRVGCSRWVAISFLDASNTKHLADWHQQTIAVLRADGLPFDDRGWMECKA